MGVRAAVVCVNWLALDPMWVAPTNVKSAPIEALNAEPTAPSCLLGARQSASLVSSRVSFFWLIINTELVMTLKIEHLRPDKTDLK
jgi:hypothetical protein